MYGREGLAMRRRKDLLTRFGETLDLPREALPGGFGLAMSGQNELTVRGCRRILQYEAERICFSLGKVALAVTGEQLICTAFSAGNVTVRGHIAAVTFEEMPR